MGLDELDSKIKHLYVCQVERQLLSPPAPAAALSHLSEREQRFIILFFINHYTFSIKVMMRIVKIMMID